MLLLSPFGGTHVKFSEEFIHTFSTIAHFISIHDVSTNYISLKSKQNQFDFGGTNSYSSGIIADLSVIFFSANLNYERFPEVHFKTFVRGAYTIQIVIRYFEHTLDQGRQTAFANCSKSNKLYSFWL